MKKGIKIVLFIMLAILLAGCDEDPPSKRDLKKWIASSIADKYKIIEITSTGKAEKIKVTARLKSEYGFEYNASAYMKYDNDQTCGNLSNGYRQVYTTNYVTKLYEYLEKDMKPVEDKYKDYLEIEDSAYNHYTDNSYYFQNPTYYFNISEYKELSLINNFADEILKVFQTKKVSSLYYPTIYVKIKPKNSENDDQSLELTNKEIIKDKKNHLKELQNYYIYYLQENNIQDDTIPTKNNVAIDKFFINDKQLEFDEEPLYLYYLPKEETYGLTHNAESINIVRKIVEELGFEFHASTSTSTYTSTYTYEIGQNSYEITKWGRTRVTYKKNYDNIKYLLTDLPLYYPESSYDSEDNKVLRIDDLIELVECDYKIEGDTVIFTPRS